MNFEAYTEEEFNRIISVHLRGTTWKIGSGALLVHFIECGSGLHRALRVRRGEGLDRLPHRH
jgi:hypothetical protein